MLIKMREMMRRKDNQKGFTLIELIVVMAILAILAAIAVPRFGDVLSNSKQKANKSNIEMIERAAELYYAEEGKDVTKIDDLVPKYLKEVPENPVTGSDPGYDVNTVNGVPTVTTK